MSAPRTESARGYKLSFIINTAAGGLLLLLGIMGFILENVFPALQGGGLAWGFLIAAIVCLSVGFAHRRKYLSLVR